MLRLLEEKIATPLGPLWVVCDEQFRLRAIEWEQYRDRMEQLLNIHYRHEGYERVSATNPGGLSDKLADYFAGNLAVIDTLETATGGTPFQREVWQALRAIPLRAGDALWSTGGATGTTGRRTRSRCCEWC
ncbi:O6-methylguanine-DNA-alkyltransferase [Salmonella enterica subsp. enterica]|nr:O6-methylguanine-DNA-alkyltransferase [Salmonella enterica subsp. enterica]